MKTKWIRKLSIFLVLVTLLGMFASCKRRDKDESSADGGTCTVSFVLNYDGATEIAPVSVESGRLIPRPETPQRDGFTFMGWYTDESLTTAFDFSDPVTESTTVYAKWREDSYDAQTERKVEELNRIDELNGGEAIIALNEETFAPSFILGTYSDKKVSDFDSAIESLKDVDDIMGFASLEDEYKDAGKKEYDDVTVHRVQQTYNGCEVYGQQLIIVADKEGKVTSLNGDYFNVDYGFKADKNISEADARASLSGFGFERMDDATCKTVVYTLEGYNEYAYVFESFEKTVIISAFSGKVLLEYDKAVQALPDWEGTKTPTIGRGEGTHEGSYNTMFFDRPSDTDLFVFYDSVRNIIYHDRGMVNNEDKNTYYVQDPLTDSDNIWTSAAAKKTLDLYDNLAFTYDFYLSVLGLYSFDGNGSQILAYVNDGWDNGNNAFSVNATTVESNETVTLLSFGGVANFHEDVDVVAHEFTHSIQTALVELPYFKQSGALMEAYSDLMGELVQLKMNGETDWDHDSRNMINPANGGNYPSKFKGSNYYTGKDDYGGVHHNSTVISHALYKIYQNGIKGQNNDEKIKKMTELLFRTWSYLTETSEFYEYRMAMMAAATDMDFSEEQLAAIAKAFDEADIKTKSYRTNLYATSIVSLSVVSSEDGKDVPEALVQLYGTMIPKTKAFEAQCDVDGNLVFNVRPGIYTLKVSATGYSSYEAECKIGFFGESFGVILKKDRSEPETIEYFVGGLITNAVDGAPVPGVELRFRKGYNTTLGDPDFVVYTKDNGKYYAKDLVPGYYTIEFVKEGYITSYAIVQAAGSTWDNSFREDAMNQNFSISPEIKIDNTIRIVLMWDEYPRDLDSHIVGKLSDGERLHVYYSRKSQYDTGIKAADLDIDDTSSYGPETITLKITNPTEIYSYYVHDYSNKNRGNSDAMSRSNANVQVYSGNTLIAMYHIPLNQEGTVWHVFDYDPVQGVLIPSGEFSYESSPEAVGFQR